MDALFEDVMCAPPPAGGSVVGHSREGRPIEAHRFGSGPVRLSLLGGCHADEPVGPRLLSHVAGWLGELPADHTLLSQYQWWILPHVNPDGEVRNRRWYGDADEHYDLGRYLAGVVRELPGDDIEFGFPRNPDDHEARPENRAAYDWWRTADGPFALHVSFHGMGFAAGPWFLLEAEWADRLGPFMATCRLAVAGLGYRLHDVERQGEKGFIRLGKGFCTRPDSRAMRRHFLDLGDPDTADRFRPSSMETMRSLGGDPLTMVSEMPLFLLPGIGEDLGPPDPKAVEWRRRIDHWRSALAGGATPTAISAEAAEAGLEPMAVTDQMRLQWIMIGAGLEAVAANRSG